MHPSRILIAASTLFLMVGCGEPLQRSSGPLVSPAQSVHQSAGLRALQGLVGQVIAPAARAAVNAPRGWPATGAPILFVSDLENSVVEMYDPNIPNPSPEGSITDGISFPSGLAVDKKGTLYVSNFGAGGSVQVYPAGKSSPSLTIANSELTSPEGVAVDSHRNVYVADLNSYAVTAYKPGQTSPYETVSLAQFGQPVGIAVDSHDNVWAAIDTAAMVVEIPAGSSSAVNAGLSGLEVPVGIAIGENDRIFVSNMAQSSGQGYVNVYGYGSTTPSYKITKGVGPGLYGPTLNGLTHKDYLFQSNQYGLVSGYKKGKKKPFSAISGLGDPSGIASWPEVKR